MTNPINGPFSSGRICLRKAASRASLRALAQPVTYLGAAMLVVIYCILAFLIVTNRNEATADAKRHGENLVRIIDQSFSHIFQSVDSSLLLLRKAYQQNPSAFNITDWVNDASIKNDLAFNFVISDAKGRILDTSRSVVSQPSRNIADLDVSDRMYFRNQIDSAADTLFISNPLVLKISGSMAIVLSRRMTAPDGMFAGIVAAFLNPNELGRTATGLNLGSGGSFGLIGLDGIIRTRVVDGKIDLSVAGRKLPADASVLGQAARASAGHFWSTPGLVDNVSRLVSYRVLDAFPMIAAVTVSQAEIYRHSNELAKIYSGTAIVLTIAILAAMIAGARREQKLISTTTEMQQAERELQQSEERYRLVEDAVNDGIWDWDILTDTVYRSPRWKSNLGFADDELSNDAQAFRELIHPDDKAAMAEATRAHLEDDKPYNLEFRLRRKNGDYLWIYSRGRALRDSNNRPIRMLGSVTDITERKRSMALAEEHRANLARAEVMARLGHYKITKGTSAIEWSESLYRIMGKAPASYSPTFTGVLDIFHPDDRSALQQYRHDVLEGRERARLTLRAVKDDGQIAYIEIWSTPIRDDTGAITGLFGTAQDITARMQAEAELKENYDNLARAESMAHMGHFKYDRATDKYIWSDGLYRIFGKSPRSFVTTLNSTLELVHPEDRPVLRRYRQDVMAGVDVGSVMLRVVKDDGSIVHVEVWSAPTRASDGTITGMFGTTRDITARKRSETLIREHHANLERAERLALLGHYKIDLGSNEFAWSEGIYRIFGLSSASFTPTLRGALKLVHPEDRHLLKQFRDMAMAGEEVPHATLRGIRSDGKIIDFEYWSTPVRASDGAITGIFGTVQDITLRKRAEDALAQANQELEARVNERTTELAQEMRRREEAQMTLGQMQKMEVVGQLTAGIAHDFNNLLAVIGGSLEFVDGAAARGLTAEPELIDAALRATRRGRELVQRLLAFARQSPLRAEATTIDQLVLDTLRLLQRTLGKEIDMVTRLDAKAAVISVDRNQMANALLNLALNARDAMPEGGQLTIATKCQPAQSTEQKNSARWPTGEEVCITISDTGAGMTDEVRLRAFEPFFTTKPDGLGSGLGLSMVQGFVEQSGGYIEIESAVGTGTTVTIRLPKVVSASQADEATAVTGLPTSGREKTVLLVEDDPDVRIVTAAQLKQLGYKVHAVADGMEAIDLIVSPANIDITLTDIVLPGGLDGVALIKEAMRVRPKMGVLCMSGYDPTQKHRKWLQVQNIIFLEKPFSSSRLAQALDAALPQ